jgi:hypothetical protein
MKKIVIVILLLITLVAIWWRSDRTRTQPASTQVTSQSDSEGIEEPVELSGNLITPAKPEEFSDIAALSADSYRKLTNAIDRGKAEWRTPIEFFGKVVDEGSNPVENATVHFVWTDLSAEGHSEKQAVSDADGLFSLRNERGKVLSVTVGKPGYYSYKPNGEGFFYAGANENFFPDSANPVIFQLHKKGEAEPLIATEFPGFAQIEKLPRDGAPVEISLMSARKVSSGGQLKLEFWGDPVERTNRTFNWKLRVSVPGGGILATDDEFAFRAPENGYAAQVEIEMPASSPRWETSVKPKYFIKLPDGNFGRVEFDFLARNGVYRIRSFINPSGSRNLEYDEAVQPKTAVHE